MSRAGKFAKPFRVTDGKGFRLRDFDPRDTGRGPQAPRSKDAAQRLLQLGVARLAELQERLYAQNQWALLLIFQAMDAAGKDSAIKHVMSGVNPQGCQVFSFKAPSAEDLDHDFMWRTSRCLPERGRNGIFNRTYYEEVLLVRVHPALLERQRLPPSLVTGDIWDERFQDIRGFERYLGHNGVVVRKFFLHVSRKKQKERFLERLDEPEKHWKFSETDVHERRYWDDYMRAYEDMIRHTATKAAPWYVVPADHKWFTRLVVTAAIIDTLEDLEVAFPRVDAARRKTLARARAGLRGE